MKLIIKIRNWVIRTGYRYVLKPIYFRLDPEFIHERMIFFGRMLGTSMVGRFLLKMLFYYKNDALKQNVLGLQFDLPVGLAAGFDKDAELTSVWPFLSFGFAELGSITGEPCEGNPKPRLWRLPKSKALVVYYGLKNRGAVNLSNELAENLKIASAFPEAKDFVYGVSVAKTNCQRTADEKEGIEDYYKAYELMRDAAAYITINISCPNAYGGQPFTDTKSLEALLARLDSLYIKGKPVFVKFSPDLSLQEIDALLAVCGQHKVDGYVVSNLTKDRKNALIKEDVVPENGGISGKVVGALADEMIEHVYKKTAGKKVIIGVGGIFSAEDAYNKIRKGANLVQLITGMIYCGPSIISEINMGMADLMKRDGFSNISEARGADVKLG